jgi:hypothetical protein
MIPHNLLIVPVKMKAFCYSFQHITRARETKGKSRSLKNNRIMEKNYLYCVLNKSFEVLESEKISLKTAFWLQKPPE